MNKIIKKDLVRCYSKEELTTIYNMIKNGKTEYYLHLLDCYNITYEELLIIVNEMFEEEL